MSYLADQLKEKGNVAFRDGDYAEAEDLYTQAVQKYSRNPLIWTNRANVRLKLQRWDGAVNDCLKSIEITGPNGQNHKAFYFLGKQLMVALLFYSSLQIHLRAWNRIKLVSADSQ
jgi:STIP1 family protein 1